MVHPVGSVGENGIAVENRDDKMRRRRRRKKNGEEEDKQVALLMDWVTRRIDQAGHVPRLSDVIEQAGKGFGFNALSRRAVSAALRRHPFYHMSSHQMKGPRRLGRYRPIVCNRLGVLHADIGFYPKTSRDFETPKRFQSGFLIAKDVLSRFVYLVVLRGNRTAAEMERAFGIVLQQHEAKFGPNGHKIVSVSFDLEPSVKSHRVQSFFRDNSISFHGFEMSDSKSKVAENVIRLLKTTLARLMAELPPSERKWWRNVDKAVASLNSLPIEIDGQRFRWTPADINKHTLKAFLRDLYRKVPVFYFAQFEIAPQLVKFKFSVGSVVRPKLLATSSAQIGVKRSVENLKRDRFRIEELVSYVARNYSAGRAYRCVNLRTRQIEVFDEWDLALSY
jgi:hypothetical protein